MESEYRAPTNRDTPNIEPFGSALWFLTREPNPASANTSNAQFINKGGIVGVE